MTDASVSTPVDIKLTTVVSQTDGSREEFSFTSTGEWIQKNNVNFLKYNEVQEAGTVRTIVKMEKENALILRNGALKMRLAFQTGGQMAGSYDTEHGAIALVTDTQSIQHNTPSDIPGKFHLKYTLEMTGNKVGTYTMTIEYKEAPKQ
ncbi:DUF1934 domain-containing protein [Jeotgalibacillus soli]|uniref:DUF1934 domain-containing protein n=1 Tax=Jeotgalibacillus soli TaxID=889306 RepID=A0A0C2VLB5_9BACL|nr:DUF1934 family protein [Jeotgalibacillus soli]KIL49702.1 hypothetical protein KP78_11700 [Jeotgalibacillus soli]